MTLPEIALVALAGLNVVTFAVFGLDKLRAQRSPRGASERVPERALLLLALAGGTAGAYAARGAFNHKTRKQPFVRQLHAVALFQAAALLLPAVLAG